MASFSYKIRTTKMEQLTKILIRFNVGHAISFYVDSQYLVWADAWDDKRQAMKARFSYPYEFSEQQGRLLMKNLTDLRSYILGRITDDPDSEMTKSRLEAIVDAFHHPQAAVHTRARSHETLLEYIARFTREMEDGTRLNIHKLHYAHSTVKNFMEFCNQFNNFCRAKHRKYSFNDIDMDFYNEMVAWFSAKNYSINTIGRHIKELKIMMRASREEGLHDNGAIESRKFKVLTIDVENIYLSEAEIAAIAALDYSAPADRHKDMARDVFLAGCYTAQRFSDYSRINEGYTTATFSDRCIS